MEKHQSSENFPQAIWENQDNMEIDKGYDLHKVKASVSCQRCQDRAETEADWTKFIQNTTFHGVRFIFEHESSLFRKLLWVICVLGATGMFFVNVVSRVRHYFEFNTNVDVEILFDTSLEFPAVTICNLNTYRMTEAAQYGLFDFLEEFHATNLSLAAGIVAAYRHKLEGINPVEFISTSAHQRDDLIYRCSWQGEECDLDRDFRSVVTNLGKCYTFTGGKQVTRQGVNQGLSLVLNVEQYEYMKGPQEDAGVKILLHEAGEPVLMGDLGFAVAPGTHTLASVDLTQVTGLPYPYGECVEDAPSLAVCTLDIITEQHLHLCHCLDSYMANDTDTSLLCNFTQLYECKSVADPVLSTCSVPCQRQLYEPRLSYAQLSRYNIERLATAHVTKSRDLEARYLQAREIGERVVSIHSNKNLQLASAVMDTYREMAKVLNQSLNILSSSSSMAEYLQIDDFIAEGSTIIQATRTKIDQSLSSQRKLMSTFGTDIFIKIRNSIPKLRTMIKQLTNGLHLFSGNVTDQQNIVGMVQNCSLLEVRYDRVQWYEHYMSSDVHPSKMQECWNTEEALGNCSCYFYNLYFEQSGTVYGTMTILEEMLPDYNTIIDQLWGEKLSDLEEYPLHASCKQSLGYFHHHLIPIFKRLSSGYFRIYKETFRNQAVDNLANLTNDFLSLNKMRVSPDEWDEIANVCSWMLDLSSSDLAILWSTYSDLKEKHKAELYEDSYQSALEALPSLQASYHSMVQATQELSNINDINRNFIAGYLTAYLENNMTKAQLAKELTSPAINTKVLRLQSLVQTLLDHIQYYREVLNTPVIHNLKTGFQALRNLSIPLLTPSRVRDLALWKSFTSESTNPKLTNIVTNSDDTNMAQQLVQLLDVTAQLLQEVPVNLSTAVEGISQRLHESVEDLTDDLREYLQGNKINHRFYMENFLRVDIFFKELSYTSVVQTPAFELLSLLGEIGGFLGLLLGASVLTMCELIDYITLQILGRAKKSKKVPAVQEWRL